MTEQEKREKVIKGLECCLPMTAKNGLADCEQCPYDRKITLEGGVTECCHDLMTDTLTLLKAKEPKLVTNIHKEHNNVLNPNVPWVGKCPKCGKKIEGRNLTRFCKFCGQAVKWE